MPLWKLFEDATGVKVSYVRSSDTQIMARVAIENRARQRTWDIAFTTTVPQLPRDYLAQFDPPEAAGLMAEARDPGRRWYGSYANYNAPAYNTTVVKPADLPKSYEDFAAHPEWAGKVAIDDTDDEWLAAIFSTYGEERGRALVKTIVAALNPIVTDGHLALARSVGAGEYWLALNNYLPLTLNVKMSGAPTDFWLLDPVPLIFGSVGVNVLAPHPNAARLCRQFRPEPGGRKLHDAQGPAADAAGRADQSARSGRHAQGEKRSCLLFSPATTRRNGKRPSPNCSDAAERPGTTKQRPQEIRMKLCRYDDDRMGVVRGDLVHDVTEAQTEIRKSTPYAMKGDAVVAALPQWRERSNAWPTRRPASRSPGRSCCRRWRGPPSSPARPPTMRPISRKCRKPPPRPGSQIVRVQSPKIGEAGMFLKSNSALVGPSEGIPLRFPNRRNDHEAELVMVIGKTGSDIPQSEALDYVAGYCLGLDMTVRGGEDRSFRKSVDGYAVLGPWMVTADEIPDPDAVPISSTVNGDMKQNSNTKSLIYSCRRLIEFASAFYTLYPGDLFYTGTPEGVGPVKPGDVIVCRSSPVLGELTIKVRAHKSAARTASSARTRRPSRHRARALGDTFSTFGDLPCCRSSVPATRR